MLQYMMCVVNNTDESKKGIIFLDVFCGFCEPIFVIHLDYVWYGAARRYSAGIVLYLPTQQDDETIITDKNTCHKRHSIRVTFMYLSSTPNQKKLWASTHRWLLTPADTSLQYLDSNRI